MRVCTRSGTQSGRAFSSSAIARVRHSGSQGRGLYGRDRGRGVGGGQERIDALSMAPFARLMRADLEDSACQSQGPFAIDDLWGRGSSEEYVELKVQGT